MKSKVLFVALCALSIAATLWIFRSMENPDTAAIAQTSISQPTTTSAALKKRTGNDSTPSTVTQVVRDCAESPFGPDCRMISADPTDLSLGAVWAFGSSPSALTVQGAGATIEGPVHSEGGIRVRGTGTKFLDGEVTYVSILDVKGASVSFQGRTVKTRGRAAIRRYLPSEFASDLNTIRTLTTYRVVDRSQCIEGIWTVSADELRNNTVYYTTCDITLSGAGGQRATTLVSTGSVKISGAGLTLSSGAPGLPSIVADTVSFAGAGVTVRAPIHARASVTVTGSSLELCGIVGANVTVGGANTRVDECAS